MTKCWRSCARLLLGEVSFSDIPSCTCYFTPLQSTQLHSWMQFLASPVWMPCIPLIVLPRALNALHSYVSHLHLGSIPTCYSHSYIQCTTSPLIDIRPDSQVWAPQAGSTAACRHSLSRQPVGVDLQAPAPSAPLQPSTRQVQAQPHSPVSCPCQCPCGL